MLKSIEGYIFASKNMIGLTIKVFQCYTDKNLLKII
jgi:hypothetical protein